MPVTASTSLFWRHILYVADDTAAKLLVYTEMATIYGYLPPALGSIDRLKNSVKKMMAAILGPTASNVLGHSFNQDNQRRLTCQCQASRFKMN